MRYHLQSQVPKEYERLSKCDSNSVQIPTTSYLRRSHSRSKSPGLEDEHNQSAAQIRPVLDSEATQIGSLPPCETRVCNSPTHRVRHSQRKRQSRPYTDSSSETKTSSLVDGDDENANERLGRSEADSCSCSFSPSQWVPHCVSLMKQLYSDERSMFFREPIDDDLYPDYKDIVPVPMDLSTVQKRLRNTLEAAHPRYRDLRTRASCGHRRPLAVYTCPHSFVRDLYRIVRNSKLYNDDPETVVYGDTRWLEDWIEQVVVTSLRQHGFWPIRESAENEHLVPPQWRKTRGHTSGLRARPRLSNRSHVRGSLYKRRKIVTRFSSKIPRKFEFPPFSND